MKKIFINVPSGVRYLSQWTDFENQMPHGRHLILNKAHTGVGATQYYLSCPQKKVIAACPRVSLIENKRTKHPDVWIYRDMADNATLDFDVKKNKPKETSYQDILKYNAEVVQYIQRCNQDGKTPKIMTTYDSLGHIIDALNTMSQEELNSWVLVVDEFQAIFGDSSYKSLTEMKLLDNAKRFQEVIYLSATPFLETYMEELEEFKNCLYVSLEWPPEMEEKAVVTNITISKGESMNEVCRKIIRDMKSGKTVKFGQKEIDTNEAVFYVNSVIDIIRVIKRSRLTQSEVNILCSTNSEERIKEAGFSIGSIPAEGDPHKPFTFCTRSYFLGCDFYSTCAYSYVFADPTSNTLALDISTDLCQILGRQRLDTNPYRNEAIMFIREGSFGLSDEEFQAHIKRKEDDTKRLINVFEGLDVESKMTILRVYQNNIESAHFSKDYLCITDEKKPEVGFNTLYWLAEIRGWEIKKKNYSSKSAVILNQKKAGVIGTAGTKSVNPDVLAFKTRFEEATHTGKKIKQYCDFRKTHPDLVAELDFVSSKYGYYWDALGYERMVKIGFQESKIKKILAAPTPFDDKVVQELRTLVMEGREYSMSETKTLIGQAYKKAGISRKPKANEIEKYMEVKKKQDHKGKRSYVVNSIFQKNISFFPSVHRPNNSKDMTIDRFLDIIKNGNYGIMSRGKYKKTIPEVIKEIRGIQDKEAIAKLKTLWLPIACINGVFKTKHDHGISSYSSFLALDYDNFKSRSEMDKAKEYLIKFEFVYAIFETPSGNGIKAIILHDSVDPKNHYNLFSQLVKKCYRPEIDTAVSDISRGHFFSYDPGLWRNPSPKAYHFVFDPSIESPMPVKETEVESINGTIKLDQGVSDFLHKLWEQILTDDAVIERLDRYWHDKCPKYYEKGNRHNGIMVMAGTLCKAGVIKDKANEYLLNSYPDMSKKEIADIISYAYENNSFGCDRRRYS